MKAFFFQVVHRKLVLFWVCVVYMAGLIGVDDHQAVYSLTVTPLVSRPTRSMTIRSILVRGFLALLGRPWCRTPSEASNALG